MLIFQRKSPGWRNEIRQTDRWTNKANHKELTTFHFKNNYTTIRNHTTLSTASEAFWEFSYDEMALQDIPAIVDYILEKTGREQLHYIGHSQGVSKAKLSNSFSPQSDCHPISLPVLR